MKLIELVKTNLRGFLDDWKSVLVLIGLPMFIVAMIFASFGYESLNLQIGVVDETDNFEYDRFERETNSFANLKNYSSEQDCLSEIRRFKVEACAVIVEREENDLELQLRYDNTREAVGNRVEKGVSNVVASMRLNYTKETASQTLERLRTQERNISLAKNELSGSTQRISEQINFLDQKINELRESRKRLKKDFEDTNDDLNQVNDSLSSLDDEIRVLTQNVGSNLFLVNKTLFEMDLSSEDEVKRQEISKNLREINESLRNLENLKSPDVKSPSVSKTERYLIDINNSIEELRGSKRNLERQKKNLKSLNDSLSELEAFNTDWSGKNASKLVNPIKSESKGLYTASNRSGNEVSDENNNLLRRQTVFSTVLVFIAIFVSLLVSQFISLKQINSNVMKRHKMIQGIFFEEYLATFISSAIIISIPIASVLVFGIYLFQLPIIDNFFSVALIISLLCFSLINLGIATSYLVKEKSITLLIGNLTLVFLSFFSGFVLPLDMMNRILGAFGTYQPASIALRSFDSVVLYGQNLSAIRNNIIYLFIWIGFLGLLAVKIKKSKKV